MIDVTEPEKVSVMPQPFRTIYEWLRDNGLNEQLPTQPRILIDHVAPTFTLRRFRWKPGQVDRWNLDNLSPGEPFMVEDEEVTLPLLEEPSEQVRDAFTAVGTRLYEAD